jgi:hypothetical protein
VTGAGFEPGFVLAAGVKRAAPWRIGAGELEALVDVARACTGLGGDADWALVGARPVERSAAASTAQGQTVDEVELVLVAEPANAVAQTVARIWARCAERAHGAALVCIDAAVPGVPAARSVTVGAHSLHVYPAGPVVAFDEVSRLVIVHPRYEGMLTASVFAAVDVSDLVVAADAPFIECHHAAGPLLAGQTRAVDLSLHLAGLPRGGAGIEITARDEHAPGRGPALMGIWLLPSRHASCSIAGMMDGPLPAGEFEQLVQQARQPRSARQLVRTIEQAWETYDGGEATAPFWAAHAGTEHG